MFMDKLKQLINCNDNPLLNNPSIICERPKFQLLYNELGSMIQTLFIYQHQDLHDIPKVDDLKKRFTDAAEEAQYIGDLFLSGVHLRNHGDFLTFEHFNRSLNLDDVMTTFKSVEMEFMSMRIDSTEVDSTQRPERTLNQPALTPAPIHISRNLLGSKKSLDEIFVGA
ncbi:hypothetical protein Hdeb2414_s0008g00283821 [Helianthus debilis subsp. tardiflorus]